MAWPFSSNPKPPSRQGEIDRLKSAVSGERNQLYRNLVKLDDATKLIDTSGVRGMLGEMFQQLDAKVKRRD